MPITKRRYTIRSTSGSISITHELPAAYREWQAINALQDMIKAVGDKTELELIETKTRIIAHHKPKQ
jgi:hypothetical protein